MRRFILVFFVLVGASVAGEVQGASFFKVYSAEERAAIRAQPIIERPYRLGHIYGNTVRLIYLLTDIDVTNL